MPRRVTDEIIIHCADTPPDMDIGAVDIDRWHRQRGWLMCGYHIVIRRDGTVETHANGHRCRPLMDAGAHAKGHNSRSIGICLVGGKAESGGPENNFTEAQWKSLISVLTGLRQQFPHAVIKGHNEVSHKACPSFDVQEWLEHAGFTN